jgi:hypothetical protein
LFAASWPALITSAVCWVSVLVPVRTGVADEAPK